MAVCWKLRSYGLLNLWCRNGIGRAVVRLGHGIQPGHGGARRRYHLHVGLIVGGPRQLRRRGIRLVQTRSHLRQSLTISLFASAWHSSSRGVIMGAHPRGTHSLGVRREPLRDRQALRCLSLRRCGVRPEDVYAIMPPLCGLVQLGLAALGQEWPAKPAASNGTPVSDHTMLCFRRFRWWGGATGGSTSYRNRIVVAEHSNRLA